MAWNTATPQNAARQFPINRGTHRLFDPNFHFVPLANTTGYKDGAGGPWFSQGFVVFAGPYKNQASFTVTEGWKFHISAPLIEREAQEVSLQVLPALINLNVWHKLPKNFKVMQSLYGKPHQQGKFITIYAMSDKEAKDISQTLRQVLPKYNANNSPLPPHDKRVTGLSTATCRYGAFSGTKITDPQGQKVDDARGNPPAWTWASCPIAVR